ncbi:hypothetical protein FIBSPDRAFT_969020 [Athelia psychrophila]|uniref:Uncharacterized protein n=1 Tax=Athelia psychrophila TaxID=1759441 RepID=A0A167TYQ2_9AGAM|nr:hypothetical protein FIBSPDRAFT_969020 [Fibularhizoctonia sp. CBS 109695]
MASPTDPLFNNRNMVEIYLSTPNEAQVLALSVPSSDIQRLSNRPLKWLRFITFTVCGVRGDLSATPNGHPVDYGNIPHADIAQAYYYTPEGDYNFVDYKALHD